MEIRKTKRTIILPGQPIPSPKPAVEFAVEDIASTVGFSALLEKATEILRREVAHLFREVSSGKLSEKSARDLTNYIGILTKLDKQEKGALDSMSEEELEKLAGKK